MNKLRYAKYTMQFNDLLLEDPDLLLDLVEELPNDIIRSSFINMFKARWGIYEIGGETITEFKEYLQAYYDMYKDYYLEMINAYNVDIDMLDGIKETITEENNDEEKTTSNGTSKYIDLPNKVTSEDYATNKTIGNSTTSTSNDRSKTITRTGGVNVLELKKQYMLLIKDLYKEWIDKFSPCFIQLYD